MEKVGYHNLDRDSNMVSQAHTLGRSPLCQAPYAITIVHASHREYKYNHALVTGVFEVERPAYVDETAWQQKIASRRYLFANRTTEKEDETYPVTVKEAAEAHQRAHKHYAKCFKDTDKIFLKDKISNILSRMIGDKSVLVYKMIFNAPWGD